MGFTWNTSVKAIVGDDTHVTGVKVLNNKTGEEKTIATSGVFIYVGNVPNSQIFKNLHITDKAGWILTDEEMATAVPGIFAIGDVRKKKLRQITTAVGDGGIAGQKAYKYVEQFN